MLISTGDKDMAQLVNERITLVNTMTGSRLDRAGVKNKFDVFPEQIVDYLALVGDTSDNIPGVPKVGPKTAAKWLNDYGTLDELVRERRGDRRQGRREPARESQGSRAVTQARDARLQRAARANRWSRCVRGEPDRERLRELYTRLELRALLRQLDEGAPISGRSARRRPQPTEQPAAPTASHATMRLVTTREALAQAGSIGCSRRKSSRFGIETTSLDYMQAEIVGLSFSVEPGKAAYVPIGARLCRRRRAAVARAVLAGAQASARKRAARQGRPRSQVRRARAASAQASSCAACVSTRCSSRTSGTAPRRDTSSTRSRASISASRRFATRTSTGRGAKQIGFSQVAVRRRDRVRAPRPPIDRCTLHRDAVAEARSRCRTLQALYAEIEQPLVPVLLRMEQAGVLIDGNLLRQQSSELATRMRELEAQAHAAAGGPFSLESPKQLQEVLFGKLGLPVLRKTPTGQPSTAEDVLEELAEQYELPRTIMEYRAFAKLKSTYTDKLPLQINRTTGRVHTSYQQAVAATGRLSSADPNLQNIPIRTPEGRRIRQAFIARPGWCIVAADYSQIELRIMAHLSGDAGLLTAFGEDRDIHQATAAEVFGMPLEQVTADQRRSAKMINFGLIYGMSAFGLATPARHRAQRGAALRRAVFPALSGRAALHGRNAPAGARARLRRDGVRPAPVSERHQRRATRAAPGRRARGHQCTDAGHCGRHHQARDDRSRSLADPNRESPARLVMQVHDELVFEVQARPRRTS